MIRVKILQILDSTKAGGAEKVVYYLCKNLRSFKSEVAVIGKAGQYNVELKKNKTKVYNLGGSYSRWNPFVIFSLFNLIKKKRYKIIHTHLFKSHILGGIIAKIIKIKLIIHDHSDIYNFSLKQSGYMKNFVIRWTYLWVYTQIIKRADSVIVLTLAMKKKYEKIYQVPANKIFVVPNGIEINKYSNLNKNRCKQALCKELSFPFDVKIVSRAASLNEVKDYTTFLKVAALMKKSGQRDTHFLIMGEGPEKRKIEKYIRDNLLSNVLLLGFRKDVINIYCASDACLHTSISESFSLSIIEAMAARVPVVSTRCHGPSEIIDDGVNGLLSGIRDVDHLYRHTLQCLNNEQLANRLMNRAKNKVKNYYTLKIFCSHITHIYTSLLPNRLNDGNIKIT